ncbi:hypothetical protein [Streptomyces sp. NPDC001816]|uniref:hypothetical protein n=1 Tax=Streptomyces sp. NPDC001816 TaxID=3364612 RepID=UPI0036B2B237
MAGIRTDKPLLTLKQIAAAFGDVPSDRADVGAYRSRERTEAWWERASSIGGGGSQETVKTLVAWAYG